VSSGRGSLDLEAVADDRLPRAVAAVDFNPGANGGGDRPTGASAEPASGAAVLIDARASVTEVRLERVP
jgi:hypothetical protein